MASRPPTEPPATGQEIAGGTRLGMGFLTGIIGIGRAGADAAWAPRPCMGGIALCFAGGNIRST